MFSPLTSRRARAIVVILVVVVVMGLAMVSVQAAVRTGDGGEVPFYLRATGYDTIDGTVWLAIVFYRPPECIPADFNLRVFFDFTAFSCGPPTTDGFLIWENGPQIDPAPMKSHLEGRGSVPIWFVHYDAYLEAVADGELYIGDLEAMPSLMEGTAGHYTEELHPSGSPAKNSMIQLVGRGQLEDGRSFFITAGQPFLGTGQGDTRGHAMIRFE